MKRKKRIFRRKNVKKQTKRRRHRYLIRGVLVVLLLAGAWFGAHWGLKSLNFFAIRHIHVQGDPQTLSPGEILKRVKVKKGENLFSVDLDQIQQVLQNHEFFKKIYVHRRLPHTLIIRVVEFHPNFVLYTGRFYYVDREGEIFKDITESRDNRDYPIVTGFKEEAILSTPLKVKKQLKRAADLKEAYQGTEFAKKFGLSEVHFEKNIGFIVYPEKQKYSIKFGREKFSEKTKKLSQVLEKLHQSKVKFSSIDLNYPGKVLMTL